MKNFRLLVINPGSTSTKIGVYEDEKLIFEETLRHDVEELSEELSETVAKLETLLYTIPNVPHESVPAGTSEDRIEACLSRPRVR